MNDHLPPSIWAMAPQAPQAAPQAAPMGQPAAAPVTPDMLYPSFPNPAGLGSQVPFPQGPPEVIPMPEQQAEQPLALPGHEIGPWSLMR